MRWTVLDTPVGDLSLAADGAALARVHFGRHEADYADSLSSGCCADRRSGARDDPVLTLAVTQLVEYFDGRRTEFDLPLADVGGSAFERAVWAAMAEIPYGEMRTYGEIAAAVGDPTAARAVGVACNRNRLPVILPCHRVVGAGGKLVGFGGGLPRKRFLLALEAGSPTLL
jgi:methylated-DNA-[protein]-cysteine S-methyltransferase